MSNTDAIKTIEKVGTDFGWQMGKVSANYENGYMKCNQDSKAHFRKDIIKRDIEKILEDHIVEDNKKIETNADRVRNMTDEELEAFIQSPCSIIRPDRKSCRFLCDECIAEWLKEKVE